MLLLLFMGGCAMGTADFTPLADAARAGDVSKIRALCARGADPNEAAGQNTWTPLLHAIHKNQIASVTALLQCGAKIDAASPGGTTPLIMAAGYGNREMVRLLLEHGASADSRDREGRVALDYALTGVTDIDDFTWFRCQNDTAALLRPVSPAAQKASVRWAKMKGCA